MERLSKQGNMNGMGILGVNVTPKGANLPNKCLEQGFSTGVKITPEGNLGFSEVNYGEGEQL